MLTRKVEAALISRQLNLRYGHRPHRGLALGLKAVSNPDVRAVAVGLSLRHMLPPAFCERGGEELRRMAVQLLQAD